MSRGAQIGISHAVLECLAVVAIAPPLVALEHAELRLVLFGWFRIVEAFPGWGHNYSHSFILVQPDNCLDPICH